MTNSNKEKLSTLLKSIIHHHGDFDNILPVFDIYDEVNFDSGNAKYQGSEKDDRRETKGETTSGNGYTPKTDKELLNLAYQFRNDDEFLLLIKRAFEEIRRFEEVLYESDEILEKKFNSKEYKL